MAEVYDGGKREMDDRKKSGKRLLADGSIRYKGSNNKFENKDFRYPNQHKPNRMR